MAGRRRTITEDDCPAIRDVQQRIGDTWSVLVIHFLGRGTMRFSQLRRSIDGVSQRMLTITLRRLERDGLVTRTVHPSVPPQVEYALSKVGRSLLQPIRAVMLWAVEHHAVIRAARRQYDDRKQP